MESRQEIKYQEKIQGRYYVIEQKHDLLQSAFGCLCEASNQYIISESDPNYTMLNKRGIIKQNSDCLSRVVCVCNRPFTASLKIKNQEIAFCQRPCKCWIQSCPFLQNQLHVTDKNGKMIGILRVPCWFFSGNYYACADARIEIVGQENKLLYTIEGNFWQKSNLCPCFRCCYCPNIQYMIFDNLNLKVGKISNIYNGCCMEVFSRADKFGIQFPFKCDENNKILLMFAGMYLDYLRYETPVCFGGID